jgi:hypothetical protein
MKKVRVNSVYEYKPVYLDRFDPPVGNPKKGDLLTVVNLHGCPKANTMGMCYVNFESGKFAGMVCTNSLKRKD